MVATPGDPRNGIPLRTLSEVSGGDVRINIAYGGSCTGGKKADMDMYASVLARAVEQGKRVAEGVHLYIQFGSQDIRRYAEEKGYIDVFSKAGAELVDPSCGACIKAGPGVSFTPDEVTILHGGDTGISYGTSVGLFEVAGGEYELKNRWTATLVKEDGRWKLASYHVSMNVLDNPILNAAKGGLVWAGLAALVVGGAIGLFAGRAWGRAKSRPA